MKKTKTVDAYYCDICGEEVSNENYFVKPFSICSLQFQLYDVLGSGHLVKARHIRRENPCKKQICNNCVEEHINQALEKLFE